MMMQMTNSIGTIPWTMTTTTLKLKLKWKMLVKKLIQKTKEDEEVVEKGWARVDAKDEAGDGDASKKVVFLPNFLFAMIKNTQKNATRRTVLFLAGLASV
jgi:hypothetical protein